MSTWREKAREGLKKTAEFASKHGGDLGVTGGVVAASVAIGALATGHVSGSGEALTVAESGARNVLTLGILHTSGWLGAKAVADKLLTEMGSGQRNLFGEQWDRKSAENTDPKRGASLHSFGEATQSIQFKEALSEVLQGLESNPDSKAAMVKMLKESPEAQRQFIDLWNARETSHNDQTNEAIQKLTRPKPLLPTGGENSDEDGVTGPAPG